MSTKAKHVKAGNASYLHEDAGGWSRIGRTEPDALNPTRYIISHGRDGFPAHTTESLPEATTAEEIAAAMRAIAPLTKWREV